MPVNIGLLPSAALTGLSEEQQNNLQNQATTQFLLGTLLTGDPSMGYKGAISLPEQAMSAQTQRIALDKAQRDLEELNNFRSQYAPSPTDAAGRAMAGGGGPTRAAAQAQTAILNAPIDIDAAQRAALGIVGNQYQPRIIESLKAMAPKTLEGGAVVSAGGRLQQYIPQLSPSQGTMIGAEIVNGRPVPFSQEIPGAVATRGRIAGTETFNRESNTFRDIILPSGAKSVALPSEIRGSAGVGNTINTGTSTGGSLVQTSSDIAKNKAAEEDYLAFSKTAFENAQTAPTRKESAEFLYNASDKMDPNVATPFFAQSAGYLRVIPGVGDKYDSFVGDYTLMNQTRAKGILTGFSSVKGNANPQEVKIVENAVNNPVKDPKWTTKWLSAIEIATADKDIARENFKANYQGDVRKATTAWQNSPDNPRIYSHPKVDQFLREQISANPAKPVLPAGFGLVQNKAGQYGVRKPDGSVMSLGQ
jgi:hypothetical protein